ncbi:alpha/beta hydrolase [Streptomyces violarus]|uniref:Pimeloyl-ACP methyl ester carboxylesterase n=1 Tax=Streptomyces violarus TaxID=67380 RepID=A0A7W5F2V5_9ACTN|nr:MULTISPECIES: alpha/beta hydrolase [Streptomyces]MBB3077929.1 pimeloyl-ACP methyl ester carboxylesterase [Streptomyces violarus]WRT99899.1 alpha/beta hydrolase [Streptomyces sp. CGMCC 4.1772]GHD18898.1 alpha/beta hydrolase [Streptomyces violarus]
MAPFLAYEDKGPASSRQPLVPKVPLVLVHGHPFDRTMWAPQLETFSADRRVIAPDLRGYGASPVTPAVTDFSGFARDIEALLDELKVESFVLAGLSMGGQIAMDCYRLFPERVSGLVLADTFPSAETPQGVRTRDAMADRLMAEGMRGYADEVLERMVAPYAPDGVKAHVHRMMTATAPKGAAAALRARARRPGYDDLLTRVSVPALVVVGADDTFTPVSDALAMHTALPDAALHIIDGAAHMPNLERPDVFDQALAEFLARVDARQPSPAPPRP